MKPDRWLGVELRHLAALEALARTGSFGGAARELGYSQSAVSQQIAQLEKVVGQRLVERPGGPRPVSLTDAGRLLLRHADSIVAQLEAAQADMEALAEGAAGPLRVGIYQSVGARLLPPLLHRFSEKWPRVEIQLREEADDAELLRLVERGELDVAFGDLPLEEGPFELVELIRDPYVLLVAADSPLAERDAAPSVRELSGLPLIAWRTQSSAEEFLRGRVPDLNVLFRTDDNGTLVGSRAAARRQPAQSGGRRASLRHADSAPGDRPRVAPRPLPLGGGRGVRRRGAAGRRRVQSRGSPRRART